MSDEWVNVAFDEDDMAEAPAPKKKRGVMRKASRGEARVDATISVHLYKHHDDTQRWQSKKWTWEDLPDKLLTLGRLALEGGAKDKHDLPVWLPVTTVDDIKRRRKGDIEQVELLALDFDSKDGRDAAIDEVVELFSAWDGWAYTSWSHTAKKPKVRVVLRLDAPVAPQHYYRVWHWAERRCASAGLIVDPARKNANSLWFAPVRKAEFEERRWSGRDGALPTQLILTGSLKREESGGESFDPVEDDLIFDHEEGRTSIATWASTARPGDKLKGACPFVKEASMGSAFLRKRASGVLVVCTSANHGHPTPYQRWWHDPKAGGVVRSPDRALMDRFDWKLDKEGRRVAIKPTVHNVQLILSEDPRWAKRIWFDEMADCKRIDDRRWTGKADVWKIRLWLEQVYGIEPNPDLIAGAVECVVDAGRRDPLVEHLDKLKWDGKPRIDRWLQRAFGAEDDELHRGIGRKFLIQLVARAYQPGCKADHVLVLVGDQGEGKGKTLRALAGDVWFSDTMFDIGHKDAFQQLKGVWLYEFAELASIRRHDQIEAVKSYLTSSTDTYRKSYGEDSMPHPRRTVFVGTTNEEAFLHDTTGNRRFWPVAIHRADDEWVRSRRDQLLAEAVAAYKTGEAWHFQREVEVEIAAHTTKFEVKEAYAEPIHAWLQSTGFRAVTASDVMTHALELPPHKFDRAVESRVGIVMRRELKWRKTRVRAGELDIYVFHAPEVTPVEARTIVLKRLKYLAAGPRRTGGDVIEFPVTPLTP